MKFKNFIKRNYLDILLGLFSFILPLIILFFIFKAKGFLDLKDGNPTIIMDDMQSIYIAFMRNLRNKLINHESFIYSMNKTFGGDYLSIYSFYLASPFNYLVVFFKDESIPLFFVLSMILKMSLASLNMYLCLRVSLKNKKIGYIAFSFAYGLISYSFVEMNNYMWLDGVMILPLVILGLKQIEERKHYWIYVVSLSYALLTSWYLGAMICMFVIIFTIFQFIAMNGKFKEKSPYLLRFIICSLVAGLISSPLWLTAFIHLAGTKATGGLPKVSKLFSPSMFLTGLLENNYTSSRNISMNHGYASMFTSSVTLMFMTLFFFNKGYSLKYRLSYLGLFIAYFFIVSQNQISAIFHGGQEPTWFPTRYSFVVGFIVCHLSALSFDKLDKSPIWSISIPMVAMLIVLLIVTKVPNEIPEGRGEQLYTFSKVSLIIYIVVTALSLIYIILNKTLKTNKLLVSIPFSIILVCLTCVSSIKGANNVLDVNLKENCYQKYDRYTKDDQYQLDVDNIQSYDNSTYRMEMMFNRPGNYNEIDNNPMFYSYNGISHFCSSEKKEVMSYMSKIGFHYNGFFEKYENGSTLTMNSLLGIKYLIDDESKWNTHKPLFVNSEPYKELEFSGSSNSIKYYQNEYALPLCFAANHMNNSFISEGSKIEGKSTTYWYDHFEYQNQIFKTLVDNIRNSDDTQKDIFNSLIINNIDYRNLEIKKDEHNLINVMNAKVGSYITFNYEVPSEGINNNLYFSEKNYFNNAYYYLNNNKEEITTYWHKGIKGIKDTLSHKGNLKITFIEETNNQLIRPELYYENKAILKEYIDELSKQSSFDLKCFKKPFSYGYEGSININKNNQDLYFTIPYEGNVSIYVDGKKMEAKKTLNIFSGCNLENIEKGNHIIKWVYRDKGLIGSIILANIGVASLVGIILFYNKVEDYKIVKKSDN